MGEIELTDQIQAVKCFAAKKTYKKNNCVKSSEKKRKLDCQEFNNEEMKNDKNGEVVKTDGERHGEDNDKSGIVNLNQVNRIIFYVIMSIYVIRNINCIVYDTIQNTF